MTTDKKSITEVRIGISDSSQDLRLESLISQPDLLALVQESLNGTAPLVISDLKGHQVVVPANKISFVEFGSLPERKVGFTTL